MRPTSLTGQGNGTRPYPLDGWKASDDLKTSTPHIRKGLKWHNGRELDADAIVRNLDHLLDAPTGSSGLGRMNG